MAPVILRSRVARMGTSRGIPVPLPMLADLRIGDEIELIAEGSELRIRAARRPRDGWAEQFATMHAAGDDRLPDLDGAVNRFDETEWVW